MKAAEQENGNMIKEAYIGLYNVYCARGDNEEAEACLREGYQQTQNEEIKELLEQIIIEKFEQAGLNVDIYLNYEPQKKRFEPHGGAKCVTQNKQRCCGLALYSRTAGCRQGRLP